MTSLHTGFSLGGPLHNVPSYPKGTDAYWILEAFKESLNSIGITNPNPAVGCILVDSQGEEISRGATEAFRGKHAETVAFDKVKDLQRLEGATAYVTLEPCSHKGNQPPCVERLAASKIKRVVISCLDLNPQVSGQGVRKLKEAGKIVDIGTLSNEVSAWHFPFFASQILKRPVVALKWAQTLDGQLSDDLDCSQWISGPTSRAYTHWMRQRYDAILVGARTVLADCPRLNVRDCREPHHHQPVPIILDLKGRCFDVHAKLQDHLNTTTFTLDRPLIFISLDSALKGRKNTWLHSKPNIQFISLPGVQIIPELMTSLRSPVVETILGYPLQSVMVEGGAQTLSLFLKAGVGDLIHAFIAPKMTGGKKNRISLDRLLVDPLRFEMLSSFRLGDDTVVEMANQDLAKKIFSDV